MPTSSLTIEELANTVRSTRRAAGLTQNELADLAGVGKTAVFDIEKGKATVQLDTLLKVLRTLSIELRLHPPIASINDERD